MADLKAFNESQVFTSLRPSFQILQAKNTKDSVPYLTHLIHLGKRIYLVLVFQTNASLNGNTSHIRLHITQLHYVTDFNHVS